MAYRSMKFALFGNVYQAKKSTAVQKLFSVISAKGGELSIQKDFHSFLKDKVKIEIPDCKIIDGNDFTADIAVCMGGDGTFLDVASRVGVKEIPILGINTGRLGFLANFSSDEIEYAIDCIYSNDFKIEKHSVLQITCDDAELKGCPYALNEIAILKHDISSMIGIKTSINGEYLTTYLADGLIVGTPTGSTAYSLSVGGPIIVPQSETISLAPVAPHSLNARPLVLCDDSEIELTVESRSHNFLIAIDGRSQSYEEGITLRIKKAPHCVKSITKPGHSYFKTLRHKMMWGADNRR